MRIREWIGHNMERSWIYGIDGLAFAGEGQFRFGVWPQFDVRRPNHEYLTILWPIYENQHHRSIWVSYPRMADQQRRLASPLSGT